MKGIKMDQAIAIAAFAAGLLSTTASIMLIYTLMRAEEVVEKLVEKFDAEKKEFDDTVTEIANIIMKKKI